MGREMSILPPGGQKWYINYLYGCYKSSMEVISVRFDPLLEIVFTFYTYTLGDPISIFFWDYV